MDVYQGVIFYKIPKLSTVLVHDDRGLIFVFQQKTELNIGDKIRFNLYWGDDIEMPNQFFEKDETKSIKNNKLFYKLSDIEELLSVNCISYLDSPNLSSATFEYFHKCVSSYINHLDIESVFNSFTIKVEESHIKKCGDDDTYMVERIASINTKDMYLSTLFPIGRTYLYYESAFVSWHELKDESGYTESDFGIQVKEQKRFIRIAKKKYNLEEHHRFLLSRLLYQYTKRITELSNESKRKYELDIKRYPTFFYTQLFSHCDSYTYDELINFILSYNKFQGNKNVLPEYKSEILATYNSQNYKLDDIDKFGFDYDF